MLTLLFQIFIVFNEKRAMCFKPNSLYSRGNILISCFKLCWCVIKQHSSILISCFKFKTCSSSIKVKLFRSFLWNAYGCHLWSTYKQYMYKWVVVGNNICRKLFFYYHSSSSARRTKILNYLFIICYVYYILHCIICIWNFMFWNKLIELK